MDGFENAFPALHASAWRVAYVIVGDPSDAEDIAAEATTRACVRWDRVWSFAEAWTVRVAGNLAVNEVRRRRRRVPDDVPPGGSERVERIDLQRALLALPRRQREVVVLRYLADLPEAAVAETLGLSAGTVKSHSARGLASLRVRLADGP